MRPARVPRNTKAAALNERGPSEAAGDSPQVLAQLLSDLSDTVRGAKGLRDRHVLVRDVASVLCGMRPFTTIDYLPNAPSVISALRPLAPRLASAGLALLTLDGVVCAADTARLTAHIQGLLGPAPGPSSGPHPRPILIQFSPADEAPSMTSIHDHADVVEALRGAMAAVEVALMVGAERPVVSLESLVEGPKRRLLPTITGLLLGYPCVYLLDPSDPDGAARRITETRVTIIRTSVPYHRAAMTEDRHALMSFSVPSSLIHPSGVSMVDWSTAAVRAWVEARRAEAEEGGSLLGMWGRAECFAQQVQRGMAVVL